MYVLFFILSIPKNKRDKALIQIRSAISKKKTNSKRNTTIDRPTKFFEPCSSAWMCIH